MAKNLQAKLSPNDSVALFDINQEAMKRLAGEMKPTTHVSSFLPFPLDIFALVITAWAGISYLCLFLFVRKKQACSMVAMTNGLIFWTFVSISCF